jgi:YidC/Oxa1 family membrane protein insertase
MTEEAEVRIETPLYEAVLSNVGPSIKSFKLKKYKKTTSPESSLVELVSVPKGMGDFLSVGFSPQSERPSVPVVYQVDKQNITLRSGSAPEDVVFRSTNPGGLSTQQIYRFYPDRYQIDLTVDVSDQSEKPASGNFIAGLKALPPEEKKSYYAYVGLALFMDDKLEEVKIKKAQEEKVLSGQIDWMAYEDDYFISAVIPSEAPKATFKGRLLPSGLLEATYFSPTVSLNPSQTVSSRFTLYLGPLEVTVLKDVGNHLDRAVDFGWTDIIAKPLLYLLRFFDRYTHNYGIAIILLTIMVKILFWPLTHKSYKSMKEMQKLQPRMAKIREKYKGDKEQMNKEMMALYKTYKVNPMSGCLPMVIQIPVFFALYRILGSAIELRHAPFMLWINDLSAPDRLFHFTFEIPFMKPPYGIPVLTLLMGASMFVQQKMTPSPGDPSQAKIMMFLPIIFTFMFINFPSGLVLYWLVNNLLSIGQQYRIQKSSV